MTTKQVNQLYNALILAFENSATVSIGQTDKNRIWEIYRKIDNAVKCEKQLRQQTARPKSYPQLQFSQYNYSAPVQPERFTFPDFLKQKPTNMRETERNKLASEYENNFLYNGVHPLDAFFAERDIAKLLNQPYLDEDNYGYREHHPVDAFGAKERSLKYNCVSQYSGYSGRTAATSQTCSQSIQFPFYS